MSDCYYDVAQICLNGHLITDLAHDYPHHRRNFCAKCGQPTIMQCPECNFGIPGYYHVSGFIGGDDFSMPSYCHNCGKPFPWTTRKIDAAIKLAIEDGKLTDDEVRLFSESIQEIAQDTPETELAATRLKKLILKLSQSAGQAIHRIIVEIASESIKKIITGN